MHEHSTISASNEPTTTVHWPRPCIAQVVLGGEHDIASANDLTETLVETVHDCSLLVVDVSTTEFIDSSTIHSLLTAKERADAAGCGFNLVLGTAPVVRRALEVTGALTILNPVHTVDQALANLREGQGRGGEDREASARPA